VVAVIGLAHAPQLLGALVLAPYFGTPLAALLSAWTLAATIVATSAVFGLALPEAIACAAGGWLLSHSGSARWGARSCGSGAGCATGSWAPTPDRRRMVR
jgi:hypothetical protein